MNPTTPACPNSLFAPVRAVSNGAGSWQLRCEDRVVAALLDEEQAAYIAHCLNSHAALVAERDRLIQGSIDFADHRKVAEDRLTDRIKALEAERALNAALIAEGGRLREALEKIAFEPIGDADASAASVLDGCVAIARAALEGGGA